MEDHAMGATIDAHQHFWELDRLHYDWPTPDLEAICRDFGPEDLKPHLDACAIDAAVIVQAHHSVEEAQWLLSLTDEHDWLVGVVGWIDLADPNVGVVLDRLGHHPKFVGVRHIWHDEPNDNWIMQPEVLRGLSELARRDIPYDLLVKPPHLELVPQIARAVPNLRMVVDHIGKPPIADGLMEPWLERLKAVAEFPQICCKVSGMVTEADMANWTPADLRPYVQHVIELFGIERLMYGSDWPVCTLAGSYEEVYNACLEAVGPIGDAERDRLMGGTAKEFYGLS
jgi:L-fucono-1,5-lactonase